MTLRLSLLSILVLMSGCQGCEEPLSPLTGMLSGTLCDEQGQPLSQSVQVRVATSDERVRSNDQGEFVFDELPEGSALLYLEDGSRFRVDVVAQEESIFVHPNCALGPEEPEPEEPEPEEPEPEEPEPQEPEPEEPEPEEPVLLGSVSGAVCAPDGVTWLADAQVSVEGFELLTSTDAEGRFVLEDVPVGEQVLLIVKGSFEDRRSVLIEADTETLLDEVECAIEPEEVRMAMVAHSRYELVEEVLAELGVDASVDFFDSAWATPLLSDFSALSEYDVLFIPCRANEIDFMSAPELQENLRRFVFEGGSLYSSDQGYDFIEVLFPERIDFVNDDLVRGSADVGAIVNGLQASVEDAILREVLGSDTMPVHYALETWSVMESVGDDVRVLLSADAPLMDGSVVLDSPQVVAFEVGEGQVVYSSFHQELGVSADQEEVLRFLIFSNSNVRFYEVS